MIGTIEKMKEDMRKGVYDFTKNGKCTGCGECCGRYLPITDDEIKTIRDYVRDNHIKPYEVKYPLADPAINFNCPFLDLSKKTEKCRIYEVRPTICRLFMCNKFDARGKEARDLLEKKPFLTDMWETFF